MVAAKNKTTNDSLANRIQSIACLNLRRTRESAVSLLIPKYSTEFGITRSASADEVNLDPPSRGPTLEVGGPTQAVIDFARFRKDAGSGQLAQLAWNVAILCAWRDTIKTGVHLTCTRNVRERLSQRKVFRRLTLMSRWISGHRPSAPPTGP